VTEAIHNVEVELNAAGLKLPTKSSTPLSSGYHPELDVLTLLNQLLSKSDWYIETGCGIRMFGHPCSCSHDVKILDAT
jgi:hypothetical protein